VNYADVLNLILLFKFMHLIKSSVCAYEKISNDAELFTLIRVNNNGREFESFHSILLLGCIKCLKR